jgi:hypothetical protein
MYLGDQRDSWFLTSFHLEVAGKPIDETVPLKDLPDLKDGASISVVEGSFSFSPMDPILDSRNFPMRIHISKNKQARSGSNPPNFFGFFFELRNPPFVCAVDLHHQFFGIIFSGSQLMKLSSFRFEMNRLCRK